MPDETAEPAEPMPAEPAKTSAAKTSSAKAKAKAGEDKTGEPGAGGRPAGSAGRDHPEGIKTDAEHRARLHREGAGPDTTGDNLQPPVTGDPDPETGRPEGHVGPWPPASHASPGSANPPQPGQPTVGPGVAAEQPIPAYAGDDTTVIGAEETPDYG